MSQKNHGHFPLESSEKSCQISGLIGPDLGNMTEAPRKYCSRKLRFFGPSKELHLVGQFLQNSDLGSGLGAKIGAKISFQRG